MLEWLKLKTIASNACEIGEKLNLFICCWGNIKWRCLTGKYFGSFL